MTDKDFWTDAYLKAYDKFLNKLTNDKNSLVDCSDEDIDIKINNVCSIAAMCADASLDYFKSNMKSLSKEAKKEISEKENNKRSYR